MSYPMHNPSDVKISNPPINDLRNMPGVLSDKPNGIVFHRSAASIFHIMPITFAATTGFMGGNAKDEMSIFINWTYFMSDYIIQIP